MLLGSLSWSNIKINFSFLISVSVIAFFLICSFSTCNAAPWYLAKKEQSVNIFVLKFVINLILKN